MKKLLRLPVVMDRSGLPRTTIYELIQLDDFPKPVRLTERSVGWIESEIDAWIQERIRKSRVSSSREGA
jgi:prophage regulatory protein